ncbi:hypothetical protein [Cyanobium sp. NIES-981]|uniref:hypothetical protein n=1 Tax=Cyanobium sp. NIES-981 TaxID=1851505 RepID=UPI001560611E|nr:hypothetical protein [Cyanobium sp. NIES-981]
MDGAGAGGEEWPEEDSFTLPRWRRSSDARPSSAETPSRPDQGRPGPAGASAPERGAGASPRPMPRSSRRRPR